MVIGLHLDAVAATPSTRFCEASSAQAREAHVEAINAGLLLNCGQTLGPLKRGKTQRLYYYEAYHENDPGPR